MAQMAVPLIYVLAFIAMVLAVQGVASVVFSSRDQVQRTNRRLTMLASGMKHSDVYSKLIRRPIGGPSRNIFLLRLYDRFSNYCRQAGIETAPLQLLMTLGLASIGLWFVTFLALRSGSFAGWILNLIFSLPASGVLCSLVFWIWLSRKRNKRLKALEE